MFEPSYYRRCGCRTPALDTHGQQVVDEDDIPVLTTIGAACPKLKNPKHGTWTFNFELEAGENGKRRRVRRTGWRTKDEAQAEAKKAYDEAMAGGDILSGETVEQYLTAWLERKRALARTTAHGYEEHIDLYLVPHLGHIKRRDLRPRHIEAMYDRIEEGNATVQANWLRLEELGKVRDNARARWRAHRVTTGSTREARRITQQERNALRDQWYATAAELKEARKGMKLKKTGPATMKRINATLSSALNSGVKKGDFSKNWAGMIELPSSKRPRAQVWTDARVTEWERTGVRPFPVMVWTPRQTGRFLDLVAEDRMYALWHLLVFRGLRRGEACALPWSEVDLENGWISITQQMVAFSKFTFGEAPKADSERTIPIDAPTRDALRAWKTCQEQEAAEWSGKTPYVNSGCVFTQEDGKPYHPDWYSRRFARLLELLELPPIRLHDLRHGSATLALAADVDIKVVQERLGHSSRQITSDTYTSVVPELMHAEADAMAAIVPRTVVPKPDELDVPAAEDAPKGSGFGRAA
ncbi:tyrosine-type recombinase/integrase [Streptomyces beijiangensis]